MSVSSEVQRTLVKSPPELWAELSDPATLARHLGELGEIRIVHTEPDRAVDWEATAAGDGAQTSGRVEIEPSGWGTRVTLSASRAIAEPEPEAQADEAEPEAEPEAESEPEAEAIEVVPEAPGVEPEIADHEPRRGFFARLFRGRKNRISPASEPPVEAQPETLITAEIAEPSVAEPSVAEPSVAVPSIAEPSPEEPAPGEAVPEEPANVVPTPEPGISAELAELEEQTTAVLTSVLDRLGAAHHRPFSRA